MTILNLPHGVLQTHLHLILGLGATALETLLQLLNRRGIDEEVVALHCGLLNTAATLDVNIKDTDLPLALDRLNSLEGGTVLVSMDIGIFNVLAIGNALINLLNG